PPRAWSCGPEAGRGRKGTGRRPTRPARGGGPSARAPGGEPPDDYNGFSASESDANRASRASVPFRSWESPPPPPGPPGTVLPPGSTARAPAEKALRPAAASATTVACEPPSAGGPTG